MLRYLASLAILLGVFAPVLAQTRQPGEPARLTLAPALPPNPSLKYRLLPDRRDLVPGNAATLYYRSEAMFVENKALLQEIKAGGWSVWAETPLAELPLDLVRAKLAEAAPVLREIDEAARRRHCDWQLENRKEGIALLIDDVQGFRAMANVLAVRARYELARGHYEEAVRSLQSGYALAHHLGEGPTLIHALVGIAIAAILDNQVESFIQQSGTPNLYWALATVPCPFANLSIAIDQETLLMQNMWPGLKRLEEGPMTPGQLQALQEEIRNSFATFGLVEAPAKTLATKLWYEYTLCPQAKKALLKQGMSEAQIQALPPFQLAALWAYREYRAAWQEQNKWLHVPRFGREAGFRRANVELKVIGERLDGLLTGGVLTRVGFTAPSAFDKVYGAVERTDRRFAFLAGIEAVRLYAARTGKLPATLAEITEVPVPLDPVTGEAFVYEIKDGAARLSLRLQAGQQVPPGLPPYFELMLRR